MLKEVPYKVSLLKTRFTEMPDVQACPSAGKLCLLAVVSLRQLSGLQVRKKRTQDIKKGYKQDCNDSKRFQIASEGMNHQLE